MREMEQKGNVTYPRPQMELVCVLDEAEQAGHLLETIVAEFTEHPFSMPALWACRDHFYRLDAAARRSHPALPAVFALLAAMAGDLDLAREYVSLLGTTPRHWRGQELREKDYYRICTELVMPYISDGMFLRIVFFLVKTGMVPVRSLTLSACRPSIINGFRDFTRFGPYLERHKDAITQMIHQLYGSVGKNVYEIMLAEWYYQNNDCFNALILATGTIPLIERESDMRCLFVALALQMRILLMNGQARTAKPLGEKIRDRIQETGREELTASLNALECLAACYDGQQEAVTQWLENTAPDENRDIYMMDMFAWLTKVRCYLQVGKNMAAYVLVGGEGPHVPGAGDSAGAGEKIPVHTAAGGRGRLHGADAVHLPAGAGRGRLYRPDHGAGGRREPVLSQLSEVSGGVLRDVDRDGKKGAAPDGAGHEQ